MSFTYTLEHEDGSPAEPSTFKTAVPNPQNELADVHGDRGPAGTAPRVGPASPNKPAMPTKQRVRTDEERLLTRSPQKSTGRSEEDTIGVLQTRVGDLPAKNHKLMSKHNDLELLELTRTQTQRRHGERTPKQQIHQRHEQEQTPSSRMRTRPDSTVAKLPPTYPSIEQTDLRTPHDSRARTTHTGASAASWAITERSIQLMQMTSPFH